MKSTIRKDIRRRKLFAKYELKRRVLKKILSDGANKLTIDQRFQAQLELNKMPRDSSIVRLRNRCVITGRARAVDRKFKISRIKFRELALSGLIPGVTKSSW